MRLNRTARGLVRGVAVAAALLVAACGGSEEGPTLSNANQLVVERTSEDGIDVVRNISGSKWGGNATLALELEIGVDEGDDRYMLGRPFPLLMNGDEIYALERQDGIVRVYGMDGQHRRDVGAPGQGPGELENPGSLGVTSDGRLAVTSGNGSVVRTAFFSPDGDFIEEWRTREAGSDERAFMTSFNVRVADDHVRVMAQRMPEESTNFWDAEVGMVAFDSDGVVRDPWFAPKMVEAPATFTITFGGRTIQQPTPWSAMQPAVSAHPDGSFLWSHPDHYRFHIVAADGSEIAVERVVEPVPVQAEEADYRRDAMVAQMRRQIPDFEWDGEGIPATKPWIVGFIIEPSGRIWTMREGLGQKGVDCMEDPLTADPSDFGNQCWTPQLIYEAFNRDGEYLGALEMPHDTRMIAPSFNNGRMIALYEDEFGVNKIRVYRLVLPGEAESTVP